MGRKSNRLFKYTVTGTISHSFTTQVLAKDEDDAERQVEQSGDDDPNMVLDAPVIDLDDIEEGWGGDDNPLYEPEGGSPLDDPDRW
ncbi:hypothetical protein [uncultured Selenomonas sp.]|uniref:hypothetical protein n=1 Tax=uncultured Selenomonas sp. TaxID=159275 RepID=UPI0025FF597C|nr:hypothetical protein [uncultured Selenomonas sp.]